VTVGMAAVTSERPRVDSFQTKHQALAMASGGFKHESAPAERWSLNSASVKEEWCDFLTLLL